MQKLIAIVILIWAFGNLAYSQEPLTEWQEIFLVNRDSETHNFNSYAESIRWARSNEVFDIIDSCETGTVMYVPPNETNSWGWDFIDDGQAPHAPGGVFAYGLYRIEVIDEDQELYVDFRDARYNRDNISLDGLDWYLHYYGGGVWKYNKGGPGNTEYTVSGNTLGVWQVFDALGYPPSVNDFDLYSSSTATSINNGRRMIRDCDEERGPSTIGIVRVPSYKGEAGNKVIELFTELKQRAERVKSQTEPVPSESNFAELQHSAMKSYRIGTDVIKTDAGFEVV